MFRLQWAKSARMELARLWIAADPSMRQAITSAAHRIDQQLIHHADIIGESRDRDRRVFFDEPLGIYYRIFPDKGRARVTRVWLTL